MEEDKTLNDEEVVVDDNNQDNETNSEGASDGEAGKTFSQSDIDSAVKDARKEQDGRWKDRIKGLKGDEGSEEGGEESNRPTEVDGDERYNRLELKTEGIKDTKEQDIVLDYAGFKKITVDQALNTPAVKAELKEYRTANSTPAPSPRTGTGMRDEVAHDALMLSKGERLPTAARRKAAREHLSKK